VPCWPHRPGPSWPRAGHALPLPAGMHRCRPAGSGGGAELRGEEGRGKTQRLTRGSLQGRQGRGSPEVVNRAAEDLGTCRENGDGGGVSEHGGSIPRPGRKRAARGSSWASRGSTGRRLTAAGGDGRGGGFSLRAVESERARERGSQGEEEREGGGDLIPSQGRAAAGIAARRRGGRHRR
jgi:hypothetical protein